MLTKCVSARKDQIRGMRAVIQRVTESSVSIDGSVRARIGRGLLLLAAFVAEDSVEDLDWMTGKISRLRIFNDETGRMNRSLLDTKGEVLVISQFTLFASTRKGNRPSFVRSAKPELAIPLYQSFLEKMNEALPFPVKTGEFGANMTVRLTNDGPVTLVIDTRNRE